VPQWGMIINLDKCTGCQACVVACQIENNNPIPRPEEVAYGRTISWMEIIPVIEGESPRVKTRFIPRPCMQCDNPPCTKVCPTRATYENKEGIVAQIYARYLVCRLLLEKKKKKKKRTSRNTQRRPQEHTPLPCEQ